MLYQVSFGDKSTFEGGNSYKKTKWNEIPDKPIKKISFALPDGNLFTLSGYEAYNHMVEATQDVYGSNKFTLRYQYFMGKIKGKVVSFRMSLFQTRDSKYKVGDITRREYPFGQEYAGKATKGWKKGIIK